MTEGRNIVLCQHCKEPLTANHSGPCPYCGEEKGLDIRITPGAGALKIEAYAPTFFVTVERYYKENPWLRILSITLTVLSAFVGYFIAGPLGVLIGLILSAINYFITPYTLATRRKEE